MLNKKVLCLIISLFCVVSFASAEKIQDGALKEPNDKRIVLVAKVSMKTPINVEARREAFLERKAWQIGKISKDDTTYYIEGDISIENAPAFGETLFAVLKNKSDKYTLKNFTAVLFPSVNYTEFSFALPANVTITIPEGAKYVYIGNFEYDLDYALRVVGFNHYDEYTTAQEELNKALGKKVDLYRAEISFN